MSYFPGNQRSITFKSDDMIITQGDEETRIPWKMIQDVTRQGDEATVVWEGGSFTIGEDIVWFEQVIDDICTRAQAANPEFRGPVPDPKTPDPEFPAEHQEQLKYTREVQQYYQGQCPTYHQFMEFLTRNRHRTFDENSYYNCSMSICSGCPVDEGYTTDLEIPESENWYRRFEKEVRKLRGGRHTGQELLEILKTVDP